MLAGPFDGAKRRLPASDIQSQRQQSVAVLRLEVVERAWVTRGGGDSVAALQRCLRPLATEAARTTGYEPCLVGHRTILVTSLRGPTASVGDSQKAAARARRRACAVCSRRCRIPSLFAADIDQGFAGDPVFDGPVRSCRVLEREVMERYAGVSADIEGAVCDRVVDVLGGGADAFRANGVEQNELIPRVQPHAGADVQVESGSAVVCVDRDRAVWF